SASAIPPWLRIARTERTRCWLSPMRPVTPFMMMPMRFSLIHFSPAWVPLSTLSQTLVWLGLGRCGLFLCFPQEAAIACLRSKPKDNYHQNDDGRLKHRQRPGISKVVAQHEL